MLPQIYWNSLGVQHGRAEFLSIANNLPTPLFDQAFKSLDQLKYQHLLELYAKAYVQGLKAGAATAVKEGMEVWTADQKI